ncbi:MAG: glycosyltransferase [Opitutae bacterium]|nr:glycosyltransferase [Opitutae bacterium]
MRFVVVHSHYRPGGVRRVIELALPPLLRALRPRVTGVVLAGGEAPDAGWLAALAERLRGVPVTCAIERAAGYVSETSATPPVAAALIRSFLAGVFDGATPRNCLVWAHNLGLGRNLPLARELTRLCQRRGLPLVLHHHDWWFDNRWQRWPEMQWTGFRSLAAVAAAILPPAPTVRHALINRTDWRMLSPRFGPQAGWLPNLAEPSAPPASAAVRRARRWLRDQLGTRAPVWLAPCRLLRRKNLAEALLLTRWLRPEAWLVTTGGVSSADETAYAATLRAAARRHGWQLRLGVLAGDESAMPPVPALFAASEALLLTSLQEGFGLPNLEAAAAGRPLLVRSLPNVAPDLARFGFRFPQTYDELLIAPPLFDRSTEVNRQERLWRAWRRQLPRSCRSLAGIPLLLAANSPAAPVPFSRLTLAAQLEVLAHPAADSWAACAPLNPFLARWRERAARGELAVSRWPRGAARQLGGPAYARRFVSLLHAAPASRLPATVADRAAREFIRARLGRDNLYPLLWQTSL